MRRILVVWCLILTACSGGDDEPDTTRDGGPTETPVRDAGPNADDILLEPSIIDFGTLAFGQETSRSVSVKNIGAVPVTLRDVQMGTPADPSFSVNTPPPTIPAGGALGLTVVFRPAGIGERRATLVVRTSAGNKSLMVLGIGEAIPCRVSTSSLAFGNAVSGTTDELTFTVTNSNVVELAARFDPRTAVDICAHPSDPPAPFCVYPFDREVGADGVFVIRANETAMFGARFSPRALGTATGTIAVACFADDTSNVIVPFFGTGLDTGLECLPSPLLFEPTPAGTCATDAIVCTNIASEPLIVAGWAVLDGVATATSAHFTGADSTGATLAEDEFVSVDVTYCPMTADDHTARFIVQTDNPNPMVRTSTVPLMGSGT